MDKDSTKGIGERLAQARRLKGVREWRDITHAEIAEIARTTPQSLSRWEAGKVRPNPASLQLAAEYLGASEAWVVRGEGEAPSSTPEKAAVQEPEASAPSPKASIHPLQKEVTRFPAPDLIIHDRKKKKGKGRKRG